ncbi:hypothetical protein [Butyrivibrio sp. VCB2006]|uniref:hypothetical protein n=1 Tax=Butyrivibrio sp. VCB2006 TaxID=1280679 RepID=UPI000423F8C3|nr:hypothetical protein [Butyrivibrio sp. VCB2006]
MESSKNKKIVLVIALEIVAIIAVILALIVHGSHLKSYDIALSEDCVGKVSVVAGSYTIVIDYESEDQLNATLSSKYGSHFLHANSFILSDNKTLGSYDFYVTHAIDDLKLSITNSAEGEYNIQKVVIAENNNNLRILIFVMALLSLLVDACLFCPWSRYNKKTIMILMAIAFGASLPAFMYGFGTGHDTSFHLLRIEGIAEGLRLGQFPVIMNTVFNDSYGYPVDVFYPNLLLYIPAVLRVVGFSIATAYKTYIIFISILTTVFSYLLGCSIFTDDKIAMIVAAAYTLSAYRLVNVWGRQSLGEYTAMAFLPVIAMAVWNIYTLDVGDKAFKRSFIPLSFGMLGLLYSHVLSTEMTVIVLLVIALVCYKKTFKKEVLLVYVKAIGIFVLVGLAFIVPFLDYYLNTDVYIKVLGSEKQYIQEGGAFISDYFAFFRGIFGDNSLYASERMQISPGFVLMIALLVGIFMMIACKATGKIKAMTIASCVLLFVSTDIFPWNQMVLRVPFFNTFAAIQFPWRYVGYSTVFLAILLGLLMEYAVEHGYDVVKLSAVVGIGIVIGLGSFVSNYSEATRQVNYLDTSELTTHTGGSIPLVGGAEYLLTGTDVDKLDSKVITDVGTAMITSERGTDLVLAVDMPQAGEIVIPRFAYPRYVAVDDNGNELDVYTGDNNRISIYVSGQYKGNITVKYRVRSLWRLSELISLVSLLGFGFMLRKSKKSWL